MSGDARSCSTPVQSATTQQWTQGAGNTLVNTGATSTDKVPVCLTDPNSSTTNGTVLQIQGCSSTTAASQVWPLPSAQGPPATAAVGPIWPEETQSLTQVPCLDDTNNSVSAGNPVQLMECTGNLQENWVVEAGGTIQIDGNYCLDSANPSQTGSVLVVLNPCSGAASQHWTVGTNYELVNTGATSVNRGTPYCLDDPASNSANHTQLEIYSCNGGNNQAWRLPGV